MDERNAQACGTVPACEDANGSDGTLDTIVQRLQMPAHPAWTKLLLCQSTRVSEQSIVSEQ